MRRKTVFAIMLTFLFISILTSAFNIQSVKAYETIHIRTDGSVDPDTAPISSVDNITYTFTDNIYEPIVVERDNIVIDGAGYTLQGTANFDTGINITGRSNVAIRNMEIRAFYRGIYILSSLNITVSGSNIAGNDRCGIYVYYSSNNTIFGNQVTSTNEYGIYIRNSFGNTVSENNVIDNPAHADGIGIGLKLEDSSDNMVSENNMTNNNYGLYHYNGSRNVISGNNITNNWIGIHTDWWTSNNTISRNNIANNGAAISIRYSSNNIISGNNVTANKYGISLEGILLSSNSFYHNNFLNNTNQVYISPSGYVNIWDDGYPSGGNYWSDYVGDDTYSGPYQNETCRDGIGDIAYTIDENNRDRYPLINPWLTHLNPPVARFTYSPTIPSASEEITFDASSSFDLDEDIVSYRWNFDDGNISSTVISSIVHTYEFPRIYNVTLTVVDTKGLNCSYSQTVWVRMITSITISTSSASTFVGFTINVTGTLRDLFGNGLKNETVVLSYTFSGANSWTAITSDNTENLGNYQAVWIPPATGSFVVKAEWAGNSTHVGAFRTTNLNILSYEDEYIFCVESNSTVSSLIFDSSDFTLKFTVAGPPGTQGSVKVTVAKNLVENIEVVEVKVNGEEVDFTVTPLNDSWLIHFTYQHSTHSVTINLGSISGPFIEIPIEILATMFLAPIIASAIIILYVWKKKQSYTQDKRMPKEYR